MRMLLLASILSLVVGCDDGLDAPRNNTECCAYCETGQACGDSCIAVVDTCSIAGGCACDGAPPANNLASNNSTAAGFEGGLYTVTVKTVDDQCFDGAMDTIVLPDGTPGELPAPVSLPGYGDLPAKIDVEFSAPFQSVSGIDIEAVGDNGLKTSGTGFTQTGVDISASADGSCLADMTVTFGLTASTDGRLTGSGSIEITSATGDGCPAGNPPCTVTSEMEAVRD